MSKAMDFSGTPDSALTLSQRIIRAEARHYRETIPHERYFIHDGQLCRKRPDMAFTERHQNSLWKP